jgi:hypothetical protein
MVLHMCLHNAQCTYRPVLTLITDTPAWKKIESEQVAICCKALTIQEKNSRAHKWQC